MYFNNIEIDSRKNINELQINRLNHTLKHVFSNVPSYKLKLQTFFDTYFEISNLKDICLLPFTIKDDFRINYPYGLFAVPLEKVIRIHASSGTTGKSTIVGYTEKDLEIWAEVVARSLTAAGASSKDIFHISYGFGLFTGGLGLKLGVEKIGATAIPISTGNTNRQLQMLKDLQSTYLCCTPSYAAYLAEQLNQSNIDKNEIYLKAGIMGAEPWSKEMALSVEDQLNINTYDIYGLSEIIGPGVAFGCTNDKNWLHINEDYFIPEIINPTSLNPLPEGSLGELVLTSVCKEALPLIRYRTGDITKLNFEKCSCGRTLVRMRKPLGRVDDMLIIKGVNIFPSQIEEVLFITGSLLPHYQILVQEINHFKNIIIKVEKSPKVKINTTELISMLEKQLQEQLGIKVTVNILPIGSLPRTEAKSSRVIYE